MKLTFLLACFFSFVSIKLNAQTDSLTSKDSLLPVTISISDSLSINTTLYIPTSDYYPTLGPWYSDSKLDLSKIYVANIKFESPYTPKGARKDLKNGKPVILFHGGFGGMPDFSSEQDKAFQRKYGVEFFSQGCMRMPDDDEEGYNQVIFDYLDKKYGVGWKYDLRYDAIGFDKPEKPVISICSISNLDSPLANYLANPKGAYAPSPNPETETSVWWYILPTSGFALLFSLYLLIKRRKK
ncbi:MAG: hypothetical protein ACO1N0_14530 [Fluviicola sp.]